MKEGKVKVLVKEPSILDEILNDYHFISISKTLSKEFGSKLGDEIFKKLHKGNSVLVKFEGQKYLVNIVESIKGSYQLRINGEIKDYTHIETLGYDQLLSCERILDDLSTFNIRRSYGIKQRPTFKELMEGVIDYVKISNGSYKLVNSLEELVRLKEYLTDGVEGESEDNVMVDLENHVEYTLSEELTKELDLILNSSGYDLEESDFVANEKHSIDLANMFSVIYRSV